MKTKYRIVTNKFGQYSVQKKPWWLPFIWQTLADEDGYFASFSTVNCCESFLKEYKAKSEFKRKVVKDGL